MLIFGLGNPGMKYRWTRHNAGFLFVSFWAKKYRKHFINFGSYAQAIIKIDGRTVRLIKPLLYMNHSGMVVAEAIEKERRFPEEGILVVVDDLNLPLGRLRLRAQGSDGGHLGLRSIIEALQTEDFPRLRIGVANQDFLARRIDAAEFVLSPFTDEEKKVIKEVITKGIEGLEILITQNLEKAQNFINSLNLQIQE
ncbi:MAG: aminoacyl-tRNA hydrolase [candidate division WOR-3 bacterium]